VPVRRQPTFSIVFARLYPNRRQSHGQRITGFISHHGLATSFACVLVVLEHNVDALSGVGWYDMWQRVRLRFHTMAALRVGIIYREWGGENTT
jgi:hypothetical protein